MRSPPVYVITLVHGTFAPNADWLVEGSALRTIIAKSLQEPTHFEIFRWTGANSHQTRAVEATNLQAQLQHTFERYPHSKHFVIAHSHGGNITLRLLGAGGVSEHLCGVITMGTPFLTSIPRRVDLALNVIRYAAVFVMFLLSALIIIAMAINVYDEHLFGMTKYVSNIVCQVVGLASEVLLFVLSKKLFKFVKGSLRNTIVERQEKIDRSFDLSEICNTPILCGVATGDEARGWLSFVRGLSNVWFFLFRIIATPFQIFWIVCLLLVWLLILDVATDAVAVEHLAVNAMMVLFVAFSVAVFLMPVMLLVPRVVRAHRWGFGGESVLDNALSDIGVMEIPAARECDTYSLPFPWGARPRHLQHSLFYRDETFLKAAAEWIRWVGGGRIGAPPDGISHRVSIPEPPHYTINKTPLRIVVVFFTGLMTLIGYFALVQDAPPQYRARAVFPHGTWWLEPIERNIDLQSGVTPWALRGIAFWTANDGLAIGASGTVVRTVDGGRTWKAKSIEGGPTLSSLSMSTPGQIWMLSSKGTVTHLGVAEDSWFGEPMDVQPNDVSFPSEKSGWAAENGGVILHTSDGGRNWTKQKSGSEADLMKIHFLDELEGWAIGQRGEVLHTDDGGVSWVSQKSGVNVTLRAMAFRSLKRGWLVGDSGAILATDDGGVTWKRQNLGSTIDLSVVAFRDDSLGVVTSHGGSMSITRDGGASWNPLFLSSSAPLYDVTFAPDGSGWAVGEDGTILHANRDAADWEVVTTNEEQNYNALAAVGPREAWIAGSGGVLLHTTDGGTSWTKCGVEYGIDLFNFSELALESISFPTKQDGWAVGSFGKVVHTNDGGQNWKPQDSHIFRGLNSVAFVSSSEGWAAGGSGTMLHTSDGGKTWTAQKTGTDATLFSVYPVTPKLLWSSGANGTLLHSEDGGQTWVSQTSGTTEALFDFAFTSTNVGLVVGQNNTALLTTDQGKTWKSDSDAENGHPNFLSVVMLDKDTGWAVGPPQVLYRKLGQDYSWGFYRDDEFKIMKKPLQSIRFADKANGWIVGTQGGIFHTTDGASHWEQQGYSKYPAPWFYIVLVAICVPLGVVLWWFRSPENLEA